MNRRFQSKGFTLVELLVVIVIVAALASLAFMFSTRALLKGQKATVLQQMRDVAVGIEAFTVDYRRPPIPETKLNEGVDTIYGDPGGLYGSEIIIGTLLGSDEEFSTGTDEVFSSAAINFRGTTYISPKRVADNRGGVGLDDGKFYDVWGKEIMFAINTPPFRRDANNGRRDKILFTFGLAEWSDKKPRFESYAIWSYGKDGIKGDSLASSDDVANF